MTETTSSAIYSGWVRHRRFTPVEHRFRYRLNLFYLNLDELPELLEASRWFSYDRSNLGWFRRADYLAPAERDLKTLVLERVEQSLGACPADATVCLLTNLRLWGSCFNPISVYYVFDDQGALFALLAQVNNTPWKERHSYVLAAPGGGKALKTRFDKAFHVSPFNPMDMHYRWMSRTPGKTLRLHMENWQGESRHMDATMALQREALTSARLNRLLFATPFNSLKVPLAIYWQALRLWAKGAPLYTHP